MNFLRNLFGGGSGSNAGKASAEDPAGLYYYVRDHATGEVMRVRVNKNNDLSGSDEGNGFFVRKMLTGSRGYNKVEATFNYDAKRNFVDAQIQGGELTDQAAYEEYKAKNA